MAPRCTTPNDFFVLEKTVFTKKRDLQPEFIALQNALAGANAEIASLRAENAVLHTQVNQLKETMNLVLSRLTVLENK